MENWLARLLTLAVNLSSGKRRGSRSWYSNVSPSAFSETLVFQSAEGANCNSPALRGRVGKGEISRALKARNVMGLVFTSPNTFEPWNIHISRCQRSESMVGPDPGRWPGLLHLAPSARCQTDR